MLVLEFATDHHHRGIKNRALIAGEDVRTDDHVHQPGFIFQGQEGVFVRGWRVLAVEDDPGHGDHDSRAGLFA